jgi:hypothetical protein
MISTSSTVNVNLRPALIASPFDSHPDVVIQTTAATVSIKFETSKMPGSPRPDGVDFAATARHVRIMFVAKSSPGCTRLQLVFGARVT